MKNLLSINGPILYIEWSHSTTSIGIFGAHMSEKIVLVALVCYVVIVVSLSAQTNKSSYSLYETAASEIPAVSTVSIDLCQSCCEIMGDLNGDDYLDPLDITYFVNWLWKGGPDPSCEAEVDVNGDLASDPLDLTYLVNYVWKSGPAPSGCMPSISIVGLQPYDDVVSGTAYVSDMLNAKVVLWAKTDRWYVQPTIAEPFTVIENDGSWSNSTYPWDRIVALLVDASYVPGATRDYHPAVDPGVLCFDEYPEKSLKYISWSGYCWTIKNADLVDPGPNYFSDDTANVLIDQEDRLRLKIDFRDNRWYCAEVVLDHSLGYGLYTFKLDSPVDNLDYNTIFAGFIYETIDQEFDIEFSQRLADPFNAQYVAQPWYIPGNIEFFNMSSSSQTSHSFEWRSDRIVFNSWNGHDDTPTPTTLLHTWTYTGENIPTPGGERMIFNLYLYGGEPPVQGTGDEVIVTSFEFIGQ